MIAGALGSALSGSFWVLIGFRFLLGLGVGGDYPVSAVMVSEYANRKDRGKLVGMVFGTQALGLIIGPLIALALFGSGVSDDVAWRVLLGARRGARRGRDLPALPDAGIAALPGPGAGTGRAGSEPGSRSHWRAGQRRRAGGPQHELGLRAFLTNRRWLITLAGTAGCWFLLDYAYYGNTISTPQILGLISPHASDHDQDRPAAGDIRGRGGTGLRAGDRPAGPDRAPAAAADRVRDDGGCASPLSRRCRA